MGDLLEYTNALQKAASVTKEGAAGMAHFVCGMMNDIEVEHMKTNMNLLLIGPSSVSHKSTLMDRGLDSIYFGKSSLGTSNAIQRAVESNESCGYSVFHDDEFGRFLKRARSGSAGYKDAVDILNSLHGGKSYTFPRRGDSPPFTIKGHKTGIVGCTTMEEFKETCTKEILEGGFLKRFMCILLGNQGYVSRKVSGSIDHRLPFHECGHMDMHLDDETWKHHDAYMEEHINVENDALAGVWQRGEEYIFKIAAIHALYERDDSCVVKLCDWKYAIKQVESLVATHLALVVLVSNK